jgi:uncharacterized protein (TIGR03083 family)
MSLQSLEPIDTRRLFRPVTRALVALLRDRPGQDWQRPTIAGAWLVRDVVAHLLDSTLRRLAFHRDGLPPPPPPRPIASERDFVAFINGLNAEWVAAARRLSPRILTDLYQRASDEAADWFEALPLDAPALFPVSWAGEDASAGWFDIGREFTELWHHQAQIRLALGAPQIEDPRYLAAVLDVAVRGLPHAFRAVPATPGESVSIEIDGPAGGQWTLIRGASGWTLWQGARPASDVAAARLRLSDDDAWRLLFNALPEPETQAALQSRAMILGEGRPELIAAFLRARSVIV